jgi:hypothetical protein
MISTLEFSFSYDDCLIIQAPVTGAFLFCAIEKKGSVETPP